MSLLTDILKEVPLSTVLKEKLSTLETEIVSLKTENAILKDDLRELKRENQILKDEINRATHSFDLDDTMKHILLILAQQDDALSKNSLADLLQIHTTRTEYYLHLLQKQKYVHGFHFYTGRQSEYRLSQKGRQFVIENNLL